MKIAILGEKKSIIAFKALGVETFGITQKQDIEIAFSEIEKGEYVILFVTEEIAQNCAEELERLYQKTLPAVLVIPGVSGKTEKGKKQLEKIIERALGSKMIKV